MTIAAWSLDVFCVLVSAPIVVIVRTMTAIVAAIIATFRTVGLVILWLSQCRIKLLWSIKC